MNSHFQRARALILASALLCGASAVAAAAERKMSASRTADVATDWRAVHALNREASGIWNRLLQCAGLDLELARMRYAEARNLCGQDTVRSQTLFAELASLHAHVAELFARVAVDPGPADTAQPLFVHPLLAQVLLETLTARLSFMEFDPEPSVEQQLQARKAGALNGLILTDRIFADVDDGCGGEGLWPLNSRAVYAQARFRSYEGYSWLMEKRKDPSLLLIDCFSRASPPPGSGKLAWQYRQLGIKYGLERRAF